MTPVDENNESKLNVGAFVIVILIGLFLAGFVVVAIQSGWGIFRLPERARLSNEDTRYATDNLEPGLTDLQNLTLGISVLPPASSDLRQLSFQLRGFIAEIVDTNANLEMSKICIETTIAASALDTLSYHSFFAEPYCVDLSKAEPIPTSIEGGQEGGKLYYVLEEFKPEQTQNFNLTDPFYVNLNFWYPFDHFILDPVLQAGYAVYDSAGNELASQFITPTILWEFQTSGSRLWNINLNTEAAIYELPQGADPNEVALFEGTYTKVHIEFWRPLLYRMAFPFFISLLAVLIAFVPMLQNRDTLVDISAAMLFGIFGIKGIIGPSGEMGQTILDIALIMLYVLLAFSIGLYFINKVLLIRKQNRARKA
jgi:hypothetical protein